MSANGGPRRPRAEEGRRQRLRRAWRALDGDQRTAGVAALALMASTIGPFGWIEAAVLLVAIGMLGLLRARAVGTPFHVPFGDGGVTVAAGVWSLLLTLWRSLDRPLPQTLLGLAGALLLLATGLRQRRRRRRDHASAPA